MSTEFRWVHIANADELQALYLGVLPAIRTAAREHGYAIGVHGSLRRDLDLIAVPWVAFYSDKNILAAAIHHAACGLQNSTYQWESKPWSRQATSMPVCWIDYEPKRPNEGHIDLSITVGEKND